MHIVKVILTGAAFGLRTLQELLPLLPQLLRPLPHPLSIVRSLGKQALRVMLLSVLEVGWMEQHASKL